jgi:hypothetical protein
VSANGGRGGDGFDPGLLAGFGGGGGGSGGGILVHAPTVRLSGTLSANGGDGGAGGATFGSGGGGGGAGRILIWTDNNGYDGTGGKTELNPGSGGGTGDDKGANGTGDANAEFKTNIKDACPCKVPEPGSVALLATIMIPAAKKTGARQKRLS